jgi:hypothetical protein
MSAAAITNYIASAMLLRTRDAETTYSAGSEYKLNFGQKRGTRAQ